MPIPVLPLVSGPGDLFVGLGLPFRALRLIFSTRRLFLLSLLCALVTAATLYALVRFVPSDLARGWVGTGGWRTVAGTALSILLYVGILVIGALTLPNLALAPLQDPLSEATETRLGGFTAPPFSMARLIKGTLTSLVHTLSRLALMLLGFAILIPLNWIPVAGSIVYAILSCLWGMWCVTAEYLSGPMARHLLPFGAVLAAMWSRPWLSTGMGAALYVVLWVPVLNCFLVPLAVVAGTLLFRALPAQAKAGT